jgi:hypothetical protein
LVGLGIGATPFISILKDMLNHMREVRSLLLGSASGLKNLANDNNVVTFKSEVLNRAVRT